MTLKCYQTQIKNGSHHILSVSTSYNKRNPKNNSFHGLHDVQIKKKKSLREEKQVQVHWEELNRVIANLHNHTMLNGARKGQALLFKKITAVIFHHNKTHERYIVSVKY